jgi:hypothetical protein
VISNVSVLFTRKFASYFEGTWPEVRVVVVVVVELSWLSWYEYFQENSDIQVCQTRLQRHEWEYFLSLQTSDL